jgi:hypothetical protein
LDPVRVPSGAATTISQPNVMMHSHRLRRTLAGRYSMRAIKEFEQVGTRGFYRPVAHVTFEQAVDMVAEAMMTARELGLADLLINSTGLTGFTPPSVFARYNMAIQWAQGGGAALRTALVARPELIDSQRIGVFMLQNRGATTDVFANEAEALGWLDGRLGPGQRMPGFLKRPPSGS